MNLTQMHERLRVELLRRIQRGTLTISLLARQTGFAPAHLSNFLRSSRRLSLASMDRILAAQRLVIADLLPAKHLSSLRPEGENESAIPLVSHAVALFEPMIRAAAIHSMLHLPETAIQTVHARPAGARRAWERFVAVRVPPADAVPMDPLVLPDAIALIDRHYNSLLPYRPNRQNLYAVRNGSHLTLRYVEFLANRLVLRPHNHAFPVHLIEVDPGESPYDLLVGRIALILNQM